MSNDSKRIQLPASLFKRLPPTTFVSVVDNARDFVTFCRTIHPLNFDSACSMAKPSNGFFPTVCVHHLLNK